MSEKNNNKNNRKINKNNINTKKTINKTSSKNSNYTSQIAVQKKKEKMIENSYKTTAKSTPTKQENPHYKELHTTTHIKNAEYEPKHTIKSIKNGKINSPQEEGTVYHTKKRRKLKVKNIILLLIFLTSFTLLVYSCINIYRWYQDSKQTKKINDEIQNIVEIKDIEEDNTPTKQIEVIEQEEEIPKSNPYWDYIKMNLIDVNFNNLKAINNETVGWIQVNGTNINYPFVQTSDNKFYLTHTFNKNYNTAGWVFMDYRNNIQNFDKNTILYGHGRRDKTMFGSLKNILQSNWYNNKNNYIIKLSTEYQNSLWQVFSVYHIATTSDYIQTEFSSDEEFKKFADMLQARSAYTFDTTVSGSDKILTLSTCYNDQEKVVMHAKLIKFTNR